MKWVKRWMEIEILISTCYYGRPAGENQNVICGERWKTLPSLLGIFTLDVIYLLSVSALAGRKMKKLAFRSIKEISYDQSRMRAGSSEQWTLGCILQRVFKLVLL